MRYLIALCAVAVLLTACDDKKSKKARSKPSETTEIATNEPPEETPAAEEQPNRAAVQQLKSGMRVVPDNSLTIQEYRKLKMPDPTGTWQAPQFRFAAEALVKIARDDVSRLPRANSPKSGRLFAHFVAPENLTYLRSRQLTIEQRVRRYREMIEPWKSLQDVYIDALNKGDVLDVEVVQLLLFTGDAAAGLLAAKDETLASMPPNDEHRKPDHPMWQRLNESLAQFLDALLTDMEPRNRLRPPQRALLAKGLQKHWPGLLRQLPDAKQDEYRERLAKLSESEPDAQIKQTFQKLLQDRKPAKKDP